jgi:hypothetical protein
MAAAFLSMSVNNYKMAKFNADSIKTIWIAEAGVAQAIHDLRDAYFANKQKVFTQDFGGGELRVAQGTIRGLGIHETLIVSLGKYKLREQSLGTIIRISAPTDYILFYDGNYLWRNFCSDKRIFGPLHLNGSLGFVSWYSGDYLDFLKPEEIEGPTISTPEIVFREPLHFGHIRVGKGRVRYEGLTNLSSWSYFGEPSIAEFGLYFDLWGDTFPVPSYSSLPQETFEDLLLMGHTGGYHIDIFTVRKPGLPEGYNEEDKSDYANRPFKSYPEFCNDIYNYYKPYIDKDSSSEYITAGNWTGDWEIIVNHALRDKLKIGVASSQTVSLPDDYPTLEKLCAENGWYAADGGNKEFFFFPSTRRVKNIYTSAGTLLINPKNEQWENYQFRVFYDYVEVGPGLDWTKGKVAFDTNLPLPDDPARDPPVPVDILYQDGSEEPAPGGGQLYTTHFDDGLPGERKTYSYVNHEPPDIKNIKVNGKSPKYIVADYYSNLSPIYTQWGRIIFPSGSTPPSGGLWTDRVMYVYASDTDEVDLTNGYQDLAPLDWSEYNIINKETIEFHSSDLNGKNIFVDPYFKVAKIDLSNISTFPKRGVIFSEVPLLVYGTPKQAVTLVSTQDIYLRSINEEDASGRRLEDDDPQAHPVGIVSAKGIFIDFSADRYLNYNNNIKDSNDLLDGHLNGSIGDEDCVVRLNKVALFSTRGDQPFLFKGRYSYNYLKVVGSMTFLASYFFGRMEEGYGTSHQASPGDGYDDLGHSLYHSNLNQDGIIYIYASSFRDNPPPRMPIDMKVLSWRSLGSEDANRYIDALVPYAERKEVMPGKDYKKILETIK